MTVAGWDTYGRRGRLPPRVLVLFLVFDDDELDAAVDFAAFVGGVGGDGAGLSVAARFETGRGDAVIGQPLHDGIGAIDRESFVGNRIAGIIGVTLDRDLGAGVFLHEAK